MQIEKRSIGTCVVLSIVTCGIYGIYWAVKMLREAVQVKDETDSGTAEILLGIFLCPVGFYMAEKKLGEGCQMKGIPHEDRSILYIVLGFVGLGIVDYIMMQSDLNKIADMYAPAGAAPYAAPQQPAYQPPQQPTYQAPQQPTYQAPQQPAYQPPQQPTYQAPQQPAYQPPQQPAYQAPQQPAYQPPQQPAASPDWQRPNANPYSHQGPVGAPQPQPPVQPAPQSFDPPQGE